MHGAWLVKVGLDGGGGSGHFLKAEALHQPLADKGIGDHTALHLLLLRHDLVDARLRASWSESDFHNSRSESIPDLKFYQNSTVLLAVVEHLMNCFVRLDLYHLYQSFQTAFLDSENRRLIVFITNGF